MSRGPGRIERTIAAIFAREPDNAFTVRELALRIYPECVEYHLKKHEVAILRAVKSLIRKGATLEVWNYISRGCRSNPVFIYNFMSVLSYGKARLKESWLYHCGYRTEADIDAMLAEGGDHHKYIVEGGAWWRDVQFKIRRHEIPAGDTAALAALDEEIKADMARRGNELAAMFAARGVPRSASSSEPNPEPRP
jgi:hypothetical protein